MGRQHRLTDRPRLHHQASTSLSKRAQTPCHTSYNGILVDGKDSGGNTVTNDEIGDACNNQFFTLDMNGVQCSVQAYWSKADNICLLPTGSVTFWMDKNTFGVDEVNDIISNGGVVQKAFWLVVEGFSEDSFNALSAGRAIPQPGRSPPYKA